MRLSAIDIEGFKSFTGHTQLAFGPGITGVIGPNGSGKSNVTEAIRWVLGEQSIKQLRGQESTDVIFHGTDTLPPGRRARVTLTFDNESGRFPIEASEIAITRSLSRAGDSHYLLNGDDVRLLDLQRLLAESGIGTRTFTVISQGTIDRYLTATPTERQELFNEATGVRALQLKLLETSRKLEKTQQHIQELQTIIAELAPRLTILARQIKRYQVREALVQEFSQKQAAWFSQRWHGSVAHMQEISAQMEELRQLVAQARSRRQHVEGHLIAVSRAAASIPQKIHVQQLLNRCIDVLQQVVDGHTDRSATTQLLSLIRSYVAQHATKEETPLANTSADALERERDAELAAERAAAGAQAAIAQARQEVAALEADILRERGSAALQSIQNTPPEEETSDDELRAVTQKLASIGEPDPLVLKEYEEVRQRHSHLTEQLTDIQQAAANIVDVMGTLHRQMHQQFAERLAIIREAFAAAFVELFGSGRAEITQTETGIDIAVTLPGKRSRHVTLLSGGERALTSIALLMAILEAQNPPFIVLDEVDAALDEANSQRFARLLQARCTTTQGIVITHNREVMAVADTLYGVTMATGGVSRVYSVQLSEITATDPAAHTTPFAV